MTQRKKPSKYQQEIYKAYNTTSSNLFVSAGPGCSKTYVAVELINQTPPSKKVWMSAFNKSIADELRSRVSPRIDVSTIHSKGFSLLRQHISGRLNLKEIKSWIFAKKQFSHYLDKRFKKSDKDKNIYLFTLSRMVDLYRMNLCPVNRDNLMELSDLYNVGLDDQQLDHTVQLIESLEEYNNSRPEDFMIDYTDMIWLPVKFLKPSDYPRYDVVFIDECLPYHMPVFLGDKTSLPIGEIVDKKLSVEVLTFNHQTGQQEVKRVVGWSKNPNNKEVLSIRTASGHFVQCTFNHKIYTKNYGYIEASCLNIGTHIYLHNKNISPIRSIDRVVIEENWVYDIAVEDNHNFYANGILVHNCQDLNPLQKRFIDNVRGKSGRFIAVGDEKQSIYSFMGSNLQSLNAFKEAPNTISLPLSVSYRCAKKIVEEANKIFPGLEPHENAPEGTIRNGSIDEVRVGDFVLCRNNLPLIETYIDLISVNKRAFILGRDFGKALSDLAAKIDRIEDLDVILLEKKEKLKEKGILSVETNSAYIALMEKCTVIRTLYNRLKSLDRVKEILGDMFAEVFDKGFDKDKCIILSTGHKAKGLEADRVFFLKPELIPSKYAQTELELYQERCLRYVIVTRAKTELVIVSEDVNEEEITLE